MNNTTEHYERIRKFMELAGQKVRTTPTLPSQAERELRARLILEEALETVEALGFRADIRGETIEMDKLVLIPTTHPDLVEIADGCADISVVTIGTLISCGILDAPLLKLVDESNLSKFAPGHYVRSDGKLIKPPNFQPPDIKSLLEKQSLNI